MGWSDDSTIEKKRPWDASRVHDAGNENWKYAGVLESSGETSILFYVVSGLDVDVEAERRSMDTTLG